MINSILYTFPKKNNKIINKNFKNVLAPLCAPIQCRSVLKEMQCSAGSTSGAVRWSELVDKKRASFALKNHASLLLFSSNHDRLISILRVEQVSASSSRSTKAKFAKNCPKTLSSSFNPTWHFYPLLILGLDFVSW